ncbi:Smr/MutS family protein [Clostridioides difficile]
MYNLNFKEDEVKIIDLHGMSKEEALNYLDNTIKYIDSNIKELIVIHGYKNGSILLNMVRKEFKHDKIKRKTLWLNNGITSLLIN